MTRLVRDADDAVLAFELLDQRHRPPDAFEERRGPHGAPDLKITEVVGKVKQPTGEGDAGYVFAQEDGIKEFHGPPRPQGDSATVDGLLRDLNEKLNS